MKKINANRGIMRNIILIALDSFRSRLYRGEVGEKRKKIFNWDECVERYWEVV
ncbi:hypothetical protein C5S32_08015 [ANME-1 cluster archaeon GoMg1]|nr:hypothetical protein [ANME-1 cluster archaeon GoMg1]